MFGYVSDSTEDVVPMSLSLSSRLGVELTDVRKCGDLWEVRLVDKMQVTFEYLHRADHTVVISTQQFEPVKTVRCKKVVGFSGLVRRRLVLAWKELAVLTDFELVR